MDGNVTESIKKLMPEQEERLRAAMRILLDYLLENGHLAPNAYLTNSLDDCKQRQGKPTTTVRKPDQPDVHCPTISE